MRKWQTIFTEIISLLLIVLFVYTASDKLNHQVRFEAVLTKSPLLQPFAKLLTWAVPFLELAISIGLGIPRWRRTALAGSCLLMLVFTTYIGYMLISRQHLPCSCGGVISLMSWKQHFFFNCFFVLASLVAWRFSRRTNNHYHHTANPILNFYSNKPPAGSRQEQPKT